MMEPIKISMPLSKIVWSASPLHICMFGKAPHAVLATPARRWPYAKVMFNSNFDISGTVTPVMQVTSCTKSMRKPMGTSTIFHISGTVLEVDEGLCALCPHRTAAQCLSFQYYNSFFRYLLRHLCRSSISASVLFLSHPGFVYRRYNSATKAWVSYPIISPPLRQFTSHGQNGSGCWRVEPCPHCCGNMHRSSYYNLDIHSITHLLAILCCSLVRLGRL